MKIDFVKYSLVCILIALLHLSAFAQRVNVKKAEKQAKVFFNDNDFENALIEIEKLIQVDSSNWMYFQKAGICEYKLNNFAKSQYYLEKSNKLNANDFETVYLLAQIIHSKNEFKNALTLYNKSLSLYDTTEHFTNKDNIQKNIEQCKVGIELIKTPLHVKIQNLGHLLNSPDPEYIPLVNANENIMYFTTRRPENVGGKKDPGDNLYFEDIYVSYFVNGQWQTPHKIKGNINTSDHDGCVSLNYNGDRLYIYKSGDLYYSNLKSDSSWTSPKKLNSNINSSYWEPSCFESRDGKTLYFSSNRSGGYGGLDLYKSELIEGDWGPAINLGPIINTDDDEDAPFIHTEDNSLYFSSKGHKNMGGYDIFLTRFDSKQNKWVTPENIGYPLNSAGHDIYFSWNKNLSAVYFASFREDSYGEKDIYRAENQEVDKPIETVDQIVNKQKEISKGKVFSTNSGFPDNDTIKIVINQMVVNVVPQKTDSINKFRYRPLISENPNSIFHSDLIPNNSITKDTNIVKLMEPFKYPDCKVIVFNSKNQKLGEGNVDEDGNFQLDNPIEPDSFRVVIIENPNTSKKRNITKLLNKKSGLIEDQNQADRYIVYGKIIANDSTQNQTTIVYKGDKKTTDKSGRFAFTRIFKPDQSFDIDNGNLKVKNIIPVDSCLFVSYDKIPKFKYNKLPNDSSSIVLNYDLKGKVKSSDYQHKVDDIVVWLVDRDGNIISITKSGKEGKFKFEKIPPSDYYILIEEYQPGLIVSISDNEDESKIIIPNHEILADSLLKISNIKGKTSIVLGKIQPLNGIHKISLIKNNKSTNQTSKISNDGYFAFKDLAVANYKIKFPETKFKVKAELDYTFADCEIKIDNQKANSKFIVHGQLMPSNKPYILAHTVFLIKSDGTVYTTQTDKNGYFVYMKLPHDNYSVVIKPEADFVLNILPVLNEQDNAFFISKDDLPKFKYNKIDNTHNAKTEFKFYGKVVAKNINDNVVDVSILMIDGSGKVVDKSTTDVNGKFGFHKLPHNDYYLVFENNHPELRIEADLMNDDNNSLIEKVNSLNDLNASYTINYNYNQFVPKMTDLKMLSDFINNHKGYLVDIQSFSDTVGSQSFNLKLTQKRAEFIRQYLIKKGYSNSLIKANGYGEIQPILLTNNKEQNRVNRRTVIKFYKK